MKRGSKITPLAPATWDEAAILASVREGREGGLDALYHLYVDRVYRLCVNMLRDEEEAMSATQETFLRVLKSIHGFRQDAGLSTWVFRIAKNVCLNELSRAHRKRTRCVTGGQLEALAGSDPRQMVDERAHKERLVQDLLGMLQELDPVKRITFLLHYVEDLSADEIAEVLGEGRGTVLKRLQRTRAELVDRARSRGIAAHVGRESAREGSHEA